MVYVYVHSRLGNLLAQIGAAATLAHRLGTDFAAVPITSYWCPEPDNCYLLEYLEPYRKTIFQHVKFVETIPDGTRELRDDFSSWDEIQVSADENIVLHGYFLKPTLLDRVWCQKLFVIPDAMKTDLMATYQISEGTGAVVVRRGDYMTLPHRFAICGKSYYFAAIQRLERQYGVNRWLIISDDTDWCKRTFVGEQYTIVDEPPLGDLYVNTLVKYLVISNSTFAWWGGYLNPHVDTKVIYPSPWYGIALRKSEINVKTRFCALDGWMDGIVIFIKD